LDGETYASIAADFGVCTSRAQQIFDKCQRAVRRMLRREAFPDPMPYLRDELLGVEFVFSYEQHPPDDVKPSRLGFFSDRGDPDRGIYWWIKKEK
jgi:hypothetical protein